METFVSLWFDKIISTHNCNWKTYNQDILHTFYNETARYNRTVLLTWILKNNKPNQSDLIDALLLAGECGNLHVVQMLHHYGVSWPENFTKKIAGKNQLDVLHSSFLMVVPSITSWIAIL